MEIFYRLSSLFALESFLSSQYTIGNTVLREVSVFRGIFFLLGSNAKSQKWQKQIQVLQTFRAMQYMSLSFFPALKFSGQANEADQANA